MGVAVQPVLEAHLGQKPRRLLPDPGENRLLVGLVVRPLPGQQGAGQHDVLQGGVLGKEVEALEYQAEVEALAADLSLALDGGVGSVKEELVPHGNAPAVGALQEVEAPEQGGLAAARGADDGQGLALVQGEADVPEDLHPAEALFNVGNL